MAHARSVLARCSYSVHAAGMPDSDALVSYPWIIVRIACRRCDRRGSYRLARLAARFGADVAMPELLKAISADCYYRKPRHPISGECQAYFLDLERDAPPPSDVPPAMLPPVLPRFRVVGGWR
jgi:hypothetical protein